MRTLVRSSVALLLLLPFASACSDRQPTDPTGVSALLLSTTADETLVLYDGSEPTSGGSHEVIVTVSGEPPSEVVCRLTTFEGGGNFQDIHHEVNNLIAGSNARFPGWITLTSGGYANNPSGITIALPLAPSHEVTFESPVASVSFFYASFPDVTLSAFDAAENLVATVAGSGHFTRTFDVWDPLSVALPQNVITRVTVVGSLGNTIIDDFENCQLTTPEVLIIRLVGDVQDLMLDSGNENALLATLDQARTAITSDRPSGANLLNAFIKQVEGLIARGILTPEEGRALIAAVQDAIDLLNG